MRPAFPSMEDLEPNTNWASLPLFDRAGWRRMAFGEFAASIGERAEPKDAQEEIYVGLEHLDAQRLHIRRWGKGSDVTGTKLQFRKGDIIFGRRRAYQRKLAVAEFDGICSAHAMVVRARLDRVLPEFLPFLMMSDRFMNRAVEISVGSLSPTINWTTLKLEEFDLPPLDQQRRIAEILWAVDAHLQTALRLERAAVEAKEAILAEKLPRDGRFGADVETCVDLQSLCKETITYGIVQAGPEIEDGIPYIRVTDMTNGPLRLEGTLRTSPELAARFKRSTVRKGEIVCALRGPAGLLKVVPPELDGANLTQGTARISLSNDGLTGYVLRAFESPFIKRQVSLQAKGSTFAELTLAALRGIQVPVLKANVRSSFAKQLDSLDAASSAAADLVADCQKLLRDLINQFS